MSFITLWQNGSLITPQTCKCWNRAFLPISLVVMVLTMGNDWMNIPNANSSCGIFAKEFTVWPLAEKCPPLKLVKFWLFRVFYSEERDLNYVSSTMCQERPENIVETNPAGYTHGKAARKASIRTRWHDWIFDLQKSLHYDALVLLNILNKNEARGHQLFSLLLCLYNKIIVFYCKKLCKWDAVSLLLLHFITPLGWRFFKGIDSLWFWINRTRKVEVPSKE